MAELISHAHAKCFFAFEHLIDALQHPKRDFKDQVSLKDVTDEFDKYKIWAGNVGAAHSGKRYEISLDYRLREASFFKDQVLKLLKTLDDKLASAAGLVCNERKPFEEQVEESDSEVSTSSHSGVEITEEEESNDSPWEISSDSSGGSDISQSSRNQLIARQDKVSNTPPKTDPATSKIISSKAMQHLGNAPTAEMPRLVESIKFTIACLYRIPIRKPAPLDRLKHKTSLDSSCYQHFDVLYIKDKFPELHSDAVARLGKMITRRRQILYYREAHKQNLDVVRVQPNVTPEPKPVPTTFAIEDGNATGNDTSSNATPSRLALSQVASSHFTLRSKATLVRPGEFSFAVTQEPVDLSALYAPSVAESKSSMASSYAGKDLRIDVPPRPKNDYGQELEWFECPYCFLTKNITNERKWKKHVFEDLHPYVCTYGDCDLYDHFFDDREAWFKHEAQHHRTKWFCNTESHTEYESEADFLLHMRVDHDQTFEEVQFASLKDVFRRPSKSTEGVCNLCKRPSKNLKNHVSRHLQQIALFSLPRVNETAGSGKAERDSRSSVSRRGLDQESKSYDSSESGASGLESSHSISNHVGEEDSKPDAPDIDDHFETAENVPDAVDQGWDDVTDKFSKARTRAFRPLKILVFENNHSTRTTIENVINELHCRPFHMTVESWSPVKFLERFLLKSWDVDVILFGTSCSFHEATSITSSIKSGYNVCPDYPIIIARDNEEEVQIKDSTVGYGGQVSIHYDNLHDYETAFEELCDWAPPPPDWKSESLARPPRSLKALVAGLWHNFFPDLEQLLTQLRCISTTVAVMDGDLLISLTNTDYDIILVEFTHHDLPDWEESIPPAIRIAKAINKDLPIIAIFEAFPSVVTVKNRGYLFDGRVVMGTPQTQAQLQDNLRKHCSWDPLSKDIQPPPVADSPYDVENHLSKTLPDSEPYMYQYVRTKFHLPEVVTDRVARHMTARKADILRMKDKPTSELDSVSSLRLSDYQATFDTKLYCPRCLRKWDRDKFPFQECFECSATLVNLDISPATDTENVTYNWPFVPFRIDDLASDKHQVWCPYCNILIEIIDDEDGTGSSTLFEHRWRQHILDDIRPFVCVVEKCAKPNIRWGNMNEWVEHIRDEGVELETGSCAFCKNRQHDYVQHLANHLLELAELNVSIELDTGAELQDGEVKTNSTYIQWTSGELSRLGHGEDDTPLQLQDRLEPLDYEKQARIPDIETYESYLRKIRSEPNNKPENHLVVGPYRFTHLQLEKDGIIQRSNVPENRRSNIYFNFISRSPGTFTISLHYAGRNRILLELDVTLDGFREMLKNNQEDLDLEYVQFNVLKALVLLSKLVDMYDTGWTFLYGWRLQDSVSELVPEELEFYGFPVTNEADPSNLPADMLTYAELLCKEQARAIERFMLDPRISTNYYLYLFGFSQILEQLKSSNHPMTWETLSRRMAVVLNKEKDLEEIVDDVTLDRELYVDFTADIERVKAKFPDMPLFSPGDLVQFSYPDVDPESRRSWIGPVERRHLLSGFWNYAVLNHNINAKIKGPVILLESSLKLVKKAKDVDDKTAQDLEMLITSEISVNTEPETQAEVNLPKESPADQNDFYIYIWLLLQKQMEVLKWLLLELSVDDNARNPDFFRLKSNISRLFNHIKLSEFPYLKWDTFEDVVEDHILGHVLGKEHGKVPNESIFENTFQRLLKNAKDQCKDIPMLRDGDGLTESHTERMSIVRKYDFSRGWLYYYPGKDWIEESVLGSLPLVFPGSRLYTEAEIYSTEAFFPYPCRRSDWCILNFESKGARNEHETALQLECGGVFNPQNRDRRVQLEKNPDFKRRFDLFCRHNDCDEHFTGREALDAHEQQCPFGFAGKFR